jgi:hypothetical protein
MNHKIKIFKIQLKFLTKKTNSLMVLPLLGETSYQRNVTSNIEDIIFQNVTS